MMEIMEIPSIASRKKAWEGIFYGFCLEPKRRENPRTQLLRGEYHMIIDRELIRVRGSLASTLRPTGVWASAACVEARGSSRSSVLSPPPTF